ncbi:MAG TPA: GtrA family protein [Beijerinckiaceae bacterium]|jgi:putative flippase GtrA
MRSRSSVASPASSGPWSPRLEAPAFLVVGAIGFAVDLSATLALTQAAGLAPALARAPALGLAVLVTFALNRALTFRCASGDGLVGSFLRYLVVCAASQGVNYAVYILALALGAAAGAAGAGLVAGAAAAGSVTAAGVTYLLAKHWAFAARGERARGARTC